MDQVGRLVDMLKYLKKLHPARRETESGTINAPLPGLEEINELIKISKGLIDDEVMPTLEQNANLQPINEETSRNRMESKDF